MTTSLSALSKALTAAFSAGDVDDPSDLLRKVQEYANAHERPTAQERDKMQEVLVDLHHQHVSGSKHAAFLSVLRILKRNFVIDPDACEHWWNVLVLPLIDTTVPLKQTIRDARAICLETVIVTDDDPEFKIKQSAAEVFKRRILETYFAAYSLQRTRLTSNLEALLLAYAQRKTRDLFETIDPYFRDPQHRLQCLNLLSTFVRLQTQYLYQVYDSPLFNSLLQCLENDTSTSVVSLALTVFIMLLPHVPDKVGNMLGRVFAIFGRIVCWDRLRAVQSRAAAIVETSLSDTPPSSSVLDAAARDAHLPESAWRRLDTSFDYAQPTPPKCTQLFTFAYGLYPINFVDYLKEPTRYLSAHGITDIDVLADLDDELIRDRTEPLFRRHLLHANFASLDIDTEISDKSRWMKLEPPDVVAMCVSYDRTASVATDGALPPTASDTDIEPLALDPHTENHSQMQDARDLVSAAPNSTAGMTSRLASPAFKPVTFDKTAAEAGAAQDHVVVKGNMVNASDILRVHEGLAALEAAQKEAAHQDVATDHEAEDNHDQRASNNKQTQTSAADRRYQREILLLRNELNFERHLKQQHLHHIGRLQRANIADAAAEAERQGLYNTTKALKAQLASLQGTLQRLRHESATSKANRVQYEATLNERIKKLRTENAEMKDADAARTKSLSEARSDVESMRDALAKAENTALNLRQQLAVLEPEIAAAKDAQLSISTLKDRIKRAEIEGIQLRMEKERVAVAEAKIKELELALGALRQEQQEQLEYSKSSGAATAPALVTSPASTRQTAPADHTELIALIKAAELRKSEDRELAKGRDVKLASRCAELEDKLQEMSARCEYLEMKQSFLGRQQSQRSTNQTRDADAVAVLKSRLKSGSTDLGRRTSLSVPAQAELTRSSRSSADLSAPPESVTSLPLHHGQDGAALISPVPILATTADDISVVSEHAARVSSGGLSQNSSQSTINVVHGQRRTDSPGVASTHSLGAALTASPTRLSASSRSSTIASTSGTTTNSQLKGSNPGRPPFLGSRTPSGASSATTTTTTSTTTPTSSALNDATRALASGMGSIDGHRPAKRAQQQAKKENTTSPATGDDIAGAITTTGAGGSTSAAPQGHFPTQTQTQQSQKKKDKERALGGRFRW
ncbi:hypothetical protein PYCC9005_003643 [Savitreella phatthalungensis]